VAVARVKNGLASRGMLVLSTPRMTPEGFERRRVDKGHIYEYTPEEIHGLLTKYFRRVGLFCQAGGTIAIAAPELAEDLIAVCTK